MTAIHWTDPHILPNPDGNGFIGYDEAGLEHCRHMNAADVRKELVAYSIHLNQEEEIKMLKAELSRKNQVLGFIKGGGYTFNKMRIAAGDVLAEFNTHT